MNVLVLNCGSSSIKFQLIETDIEKISEDKDRTLLRGQVERIGSQAIITLQVENKPKKKLAKPMRNHQQAIDFILKWLMESENGLKLSSLSEIDIVGHRVVHGGERFSNSVLIDQQVIQGIEDCVDLAPLHNPANLEGIHATTKILGSSIPQVAVFDTAFHYNISEENYLYPIPYQYYRRYKIRRYGFHGTSHRSVAYRYRKITNCRKEATKIITLHLGNGCSACAIQNGISIDTSMGFTPLEGLTMGTRSGDVDPGIIEFLAQQEGLNIEQILDILNKNSGLLGISGLTHDMRELLEEEAEHGDRRVTLAIKIFCNRVRKYIGAYMAQLGGADAIVFAGGIGENAPSLRSQICSQLEFLGIELDSSKNREKVGGKEGKISSKIASTSVYVIPTNEELLIARDAVRVALK